MPRGPVDPRLLRHARSSRRFLVIGSLLGLAQAAGTVAVAAGSARGIAVVVGSGGGAGAGGSAFGGLGTAVALLAVGLVLRAGAAWALESAGAHAASAVKSELRAALLAAIDRRGPQWLAGQSRARLTTIVGRGLDALDGYFGSFLPQLLLTALSVPVLLVVLALADRASAIIVLATLPLIPLFMVLVGLATRTAQQRQWRALTGLASGFLEVVEGLATLTLFGRQRRQAERIRAVTEDYRRHTMAVLRLSFVSGFVLEVAGSLAVALVAVTIGVRLVAGGMPLGTGLFVLLLMPDVYLPIRQVGARFHASADGIAAFEDVAAIIEGTVPEGTGSGGAGSGGAAPATTAVPSVPAVPGPRRAHAIVLQGLAVRRGGRAVIDGVSLVVPAGRITALAGPSGVGKSSVLAALLGFAEHEGGILVDGRPVAHARPLIAWCPQRPALVAGSVAENVTLGDGATDAALVRRALAVAAAETIDPDARLGPDGSGLSGGQAQRVGIARAVYRLLRGGRGFLVLDEPTSALDAATEQAVLAGLRALTAEGAGVLLVSHRDAVLAAADSVHTLHERQAAGPDAEQPDAEQPDAHQPDADQPDAHQPVTGEPDAGHPDTGRGASAA
ncbi:MAG: thiol reductant ABC exporter subunit CydD [Microbacteriaceae bacterium]